MRSLAPLVDLAREPECMVLTDDAGYLACPAGISRSDLAAAFLGRAGMRVTTRNGVMVLKLHALAREARGGS